MPGFLAPRRIYVVLILVLMTAGGAVYGPVYFPDLAPWRAAAGGLLMGAFWGFCALSRQILEW